MPPFFYLNFILSLLKNEVNNIIFLTKTNLFVKISINYDAVWGGHMKLSEKLINFEPSSLQEEADKALFLEFLEKNEDAFCRENSFGHVTASSWIVNRERTRVLFCYHKLYNSWSWVGGHADGEEDLLKVAMKEAKEETGVSCVPVTTEIYSVEILPVKGHMKKGKYVPSHTHFNVTYLLEADESDELFVCEEENSAVAWIDIEKIPEKSTEKWMIDNIYDKLTKKLHSDF